MVRASIADDGMRIELETEYRDKELVRELPGARYKVREHRWYAPLSWGTCVAMRGVFGDRLEVATDVAEWSWSEWRERIEPALLTRQALLLEADDESPEAQLLRSFERRVDEQQTLRPYKFQQAGIKFLYRARRCVLADDLGTGKTAQTILTLWLAARLGIDPFPAVVVCPNSMKMTWLREFALWFPEADAAIVTGSAKTRRDTLAAKHDVYILSYEAARGHSRLAPYGSIELRKCKKCDPNSADIQPARCERCKKELNRVAWRTVVVDEAHRLKDPRAKQTRAVWALSTKDTVFRYALTGTPIADAPDDFWSMLHLIAPEDFPTRSEYVGRYCQISVNAWSAGVNVLGLRPERRDEFFKIVDPRFRRMPKAVVLPYLPKVVESQRFVEMSPKQRRAYTQMEAEMVAWLDNGGIVADNPLTKLTRLLQFASAYAETKVDLSTQKTTIQLTDDSCKLDGLDDLLLEMNGRPLVVFSASRQLLDLAAARLTKRGTPFGMVVGGQADYERDRHIREFQAGHYAVILCTLSAGSVGLTLTAADTAAFIQRDYSMINNTQARGRIDRIGAEIHESLHIVDFITMGTVEHRQFDALGGKYERLEELLRDRELLKRVLKGT